MQLSSAQWGIIRQICAEQARGVVNKEFQPNIQPMLDLGFDPSQIDEVARIARTTARKQMKQVIGEVPPTVFVPLNESQTGRYFSQIVGQQSAQIDDLLAKVTELKAGNDRWQSQHQIAVNAKNELQEKFDRQLAVNEELRARLEEQNDRLRHSDSLVLQLSDNVANLQNRLRFRDDVGEASFENHAALACNMRPKELLTNTDFGSDVAVQALVEKQFGPMKDGDKIMTNKEVFTWFMGQWRRKSELEGFASAKKYT